MRREKQLLDNALEAWTSLDEFRRRRRRCKDFTFGRQWSDRHRLSDGRVVSEEAGWLDRGRVPLCNNLIRQLVKSIVGRWRHLQRDEKVGVATDIDARTFEEFLISGCAIQRVERGKISPVGPARVFFRRFERSDGDDCSFVGMLHDMRPAEVLRRFSAGDAVRFGEIHALYQGAASENSSLRLNASASPCCGAESDFFHAMSPGMWRVIEVWRRGCTPVLRIHDPERGAYATGDYDEETLRRIGEMNARRRKRGGKELRWYPDLDDGWEYFWLAPGSEVLAYGKGESHPFVMALYPMVDGEVRSLVDDVIDQQKYVNNLVMLLDDVLRASAKGIVLFPTDQLPRGMTWNDVRRIWAQPGGILPFRRTSKNIMPYQLNTSGTVSGATEMLQTQLKLFDEISGTNASSRGSGSTAKGAEMMARELEQATVSVYDLLSTFRGFTERRDEMLRGNSRSDTD